MIVAVHGKCIGAGTAIVASCDLVVASTEASFALTEINVGVLGGVRHAQRLCGPFLAKRMFLTGEFVTDASTASRSLLLDVDAVAWSEDLLDIFGLGDERLPRIVASDEVIGTTTAFGAEVPVAGLIVPNDGKPTRPMPIIAFHGVMDPIGLALENFDGIASWHSASPLKSRVPHQRP